MNVISSCSAPEAIGPYCQAMRVGDLLFTSGQIPLDPETMKLVEGLEAQTEQVLVNLAAVLAAAGVKMENVVKCTVFLSDMADFPVVNEIYARHFGTHKPARSTVAVAGLPLGSLVEIECIADLS